MAGDGFPWGSRAIIVFFAFPLYHRWHRAFLQQHHFIAMEWHGTISSGFMESLSMSRPYNKSSVLDNIMVRLTVYVVIYKLLRSALYRIEYRCLMLAFIKWIQKVAFQTGSACVTERRSDAQQDWQTAEPHPSSTPPRCQHQSQACQSVRRYARSVWSLTGVWRTKATYQESSSPVTTIHECYSIFVICSHSPMLRRWLVAL